MNPSSTAKNVEQVLEKLFSMQMHENFERCSLLEKKKLDTCNNTTVSSLFVSSINESKTATKSEFARLANAKRLSDSLSLQLRCEEVRLKAEIDFLNRCLEDPLTAKNECSDINEDIASLMAECNQIKGNCLNFVKDLACSDHLKSSRLRFERRKARQTAYLDCQDRKIQEAQLTCSKLEIFRDIMALEDSALLEMAQCLDKIYTALKKYFQISIEIKSRFQKSENSLQNKDFSNVIDSELRELLISVLCDSSDISGSPETISNETLLKSFEEKIGILESKNAASLSTMKEFKLVVQEISLVLNKALQWLECSDDSEAQQQQHVNASESPCIYWNALGSFSGVIPHRLVKRLLQVRRELDDASASLRKLELTFELNSEVL
ncbi:unnamed protein product [Rodentolepis nana]|uniref:Uncharacterized protein n=1 Tax=Rodentolepis nana TaxID=102285 RepID=A0A0R3TMK3_RODNA|nr:unnamed protein product [Rodentolepis nana]